MANCVPYNLKVVSKDLSVLERIRNILAYKDAEYFIYRVYDVETDDVEDLGNGYYTCEYYGNVAWGCSPWINGGENTEEKNKNGAHYVSLRTLAERFGFAFELYCEDENMMFQEYWRVNSKGEVADDDGADDYDVEYDDELNCIKTTGGLSYYGEWSDPVEVFNLGKADLKEDNEK